MRWLLARASLAPGRGRPASRPCTVTVHVRALGRVVEVHQDDLLPGAQHGPAGADRKHQGRPQQRGAHVGVAVAVVPGLLVRVGELRGHQPLETVLQVAHDARLVLEGRQSGGRSGHEEADRPFPDSRAVDELP